MHATIIGFVVQATKEGQSRGKRTQEGCGSGRGS